MDKQTFITDINIIKCRNITDLYIHLNEFERKHLIITGKNGSGKTSLLEALLESLNRGKEKKISYSKLKALSEIKDVDEFHKISESLFELGPASNHEADYYRFVVESSLSESSESGIAIDYSTDYNAFITWSNTERPFVLTYFSSNRDSNKMQAPDSISKPKLDLYVDPKEGANKVFLKYLLNLRAQQSFAYEENDETTYNNIKYWFDRFVDRLRLIFDDKDLELSFSRPQLNFEIKLSDGSIFDFNTMSHGYSALISIVTELISRIEAFKDKSYDVEGIVLIDEIETHLHVDLQKKVLPLLIDFFPKIQFIVSTHSPFVVSSVRNAVICDLEKKIVTEDLSDYGYDTLVESFFGTSLVSENLETKLTRFDELEANNNKSLQELDEYNKLKSYLLELPKYLPNELSLKLRTIELKDSQKGK